MVLILTILGIVVKLACYCVFFLALICFMIYLMQNKILYMPDAPNQAFRYPENNPKSYRNPSERNMTYEEVQITTADKQVLAGWFIKQKNPHSHETIIFYHSNAGNIGNRLHNLDALYFELEVNILIVGYRGYGHSTGTPNEEGLKLDAEAIFQFAHNHKEVNKQKLYIFGRSLGCAVAIQLAQNLESDQVCGMILENAFTSISEMVDNLFPYILQVKKYILRMYWPNLERIPNVKCPLLFVVGQSNEMIPAWHTQKLYEGATAQMKHIHTVQNASHNDTWIKGGKDYIYAIKDFIDKTQEQKIPGRMHNSGQQPLNQVGEASYQTAHQNVPQANYMQRRNIVNSSVMQY